MRLVASLLCVTASYGVTAATSFTPDSQPYGYVAPVALSKSDLSGGDALLFRPWFDNTTLLGAVKAYTLNSSGAVAGSPSWTASTGALIHSNPIYVAAPRQGYPFDGYQAYAAANASRDGRLFVGANNSGAGDGGLYALDATTGTVKYTFTPSAISSATYAVDGPLSSGDIYADVATDAVSGKNWRTVLVGGLGAGGKGYFALDVSNASDTAGQLLWEFTDSNLGYTYGQPLIVKVNYDLDGDSSCASGEGKWAALLPNGYMNSGDYKARLYIVDIADGSLIKQLQLDDSASPTGSSSSPNGLSSPIAIDSDGNYTADTVYAGDIDGNLWKVDISGCATSASNPWSVAVGGKPLFIARDADSGGNRQPITSAPDVARHPSKTGYLVYVGTGEELAAAPLVGSGSASAPSQHNLYAIWDNSASATIARSSLQAQSLAGIGGHANYRTVTVTSPDTTVDWSSQKGWKVDLPAGEEVLQPPLVHDKRLQVMIRDTLSSPAENWLTQLDYEDGGVPAQYILDADGNGTLSSSDDLGGKRVVAANASADLASSHRIGSTSSADHYFLNLWTEQPAAATPGPVSCSMLWVDIRYTKSLDKADKTHNGTYSLSFTGYLDDGSEIDMRLGNLKYSEKSQYQKASCDTNSYCIHGSGGVRNGDVVELNFNHVDTDESPLAATDIATLSATDNGADGSTGALGLRWDPSHIDLHRSNTSFSIGIQFHSNLRLDNYSMDFDWTGITGQSVDRLEVGTGSCGSSFSVGTGRVLKDGATEDTIGGIAGWDDSAQKFSINNPSGSTLVFNDSGDSAAALAASGTPVDGSTGSGAQADEEGQTGRLLWREVSF